MGRRMKGDMIENSGQNPALHLFQSRLRRLDQPNASKPLGEHAIMVVPQSALILLRLETAAVGEPVQFADRDAQPLGQFARRANRRRRPCGGSRNGAHCRRRGKPPLHLQRMFLAGVLKTFVSQ